MSEAADGLAGNEDPFEFVQQDQFGANQITIVDPESGEPLVSIPLEAMTHEVINADGTVTDVSGGAVEYAEPSVPNYWVMAAVGGGWIVEQIIDGSDTDFEEGRWPSGVVAAGDVVLVAWSDGSFTRIAAT